MRGIPEGQSPQVSRGGGMLPRRSQVSSNECLGGRREQFPDFRERGMCARHVDTRGPMLPGQYRRFESSLERRCWKNILESLSGARIV